MDEINYLKLPDTDILVLSMQDVPINRARRILSFAMARIEQIEAQRTLPVFDRRRLEFDTVKRIIEAYQGKSDEQ